MKVNQPMGAACQSGPGGVSWSHHDRHIATALTLQTPSDIARMLYRANTLTRVN